MNDVMFWEYTSNDICRRKIHESYPIFAGVIDRGWILAWGAYSDLFHFHCISRYLKRSESVQDVTKYGYLHATIKVT